MALEERVKRMAISMSQRKEKAKKLQRWVCQKISDLTGFQWGVSGEDRPIESRPMGQSGADVRLDEQVRKLFPFSVECKRQESWDVPGWIEQARKNELEDTGWLLVMKRSNKPPVVVLDADAFFDLMRRVNHGPG